LSKLLVDTHNCSFVLVGKDAIVLQVACSFTNQLKLHLRVEFKNFKEQQKA